MVGGVDADLLYSTRGALPLDSGTDALEGLLDELTDGVGLVGSEDEILGLLDLQNQI